LTQFGVISLKGWWKPISLKKTGMFQPWKKLARQALHVSSSSASDQRHVMGCCWDFSSTACP
jgi:hypothetical protein